MGNNNAASATATVPAPDWTEADEAQFLAMEARRKAVVGAREAKLSSIVGDVWVATINRGPDALHQADRNGCTQALFDSLRLFAYDVRSALEPFDNGPGPTAPAPAP